MRLNYIPRRNIFEAVNYGYLYNWYAAIDVREISSMGWSVPSSAQIGGLSGDHKEIGETFWQSPNVGATNLLKFNGRGSTFRGSAGSFALTGIGYGLYLWTNDLGNKGVQYIIHDSATGAGATPSSSNYGYSIRLVKDTTTLTDGQAGTYIGNDGKIYPTICIGTQEWLAANLKETKYRDGSLIPEVTGNSAWAALTTGGRCVYGNIESNA